VQWAKAEVIDLRNGQSVLDDQSTLRRFKAGGRWNSMHITFRRCAGLVTRR
jgi:hypothetical protein